MVHIWGASYSSRYYLKGNSCKGEVWVPTRYLRCLEANYENGLVSYPILQQILAVVGVTAEERGFTPHAVSATDEVDIDQLIEELSHEI